MQAITYRKYGPPKVLHLEERPRPVARAGEVLVRVHAAALNPVDCEMRSGKLAVVSGFRFPKIPGSDFAGEVVETGQAVRHFGIGDRVYGMTDPRTGGSYAEYMSIGEDKLAQMPEGLSYEEAASLPLVALTALQALRDQAGIRRGHRVFIQGGSGGVGTVAIQIAKHFGAHVTASSSYRNTNLLRKLGADEVVDYTKTDLTKIDGPYDIYFDVYGNMPFWKVRHLIRPRGKHVSTIISPQNFAIAFLTKLLPGKRAAVVVVESKKIDLENIARMVKRGDLHPVIDKTFALEAAAEAQSYLETRRASGKVILNIRD